MVVGFRHTGQIEEALTEVGLVWHAYGGHNDAGGGEREKKVYLADLRHICETHHRGTGDIYDHRVLHTSGRGLQERIASHTVYSCCTRFSRAQARYKLSYRCTQSTEVFLLAHDHHHGQNQTIFHHFSLTVNVNSREIPTESRRTSGLQNKKI